MPSELIFKKLEQISALLDELEHLIALSFSDFQKNNVTVRAAERNFQLIVDLASDINTQILLEKGRKTPDTYRQSFSDLGKEAIINAALTQQLVLSAGIRNVLVHEYDFEEDYEKFYTSAKALVPAYREYVKLIRDYAKW